MVKHFGLTLLYLTLLAALSASGAYLYGERIEKNLTTMTLERLKLEGLTGINVQFDGRDGQLTGRISNDKYLKLLDLNFTQMVPEARTLKNKTTPLNQPRVVEVEKEVRVEVPVEKIVEVPIETIIKKTVEVPVPIEIGAPRPDKESLEVLFSYDSDEMINSKITKQKINNFVAHKDASKTSFKIIGHADNHGTDQYNIELGAKRAMKIMQYLISQGISTKQISLTTHGERMALSEDEKLQCEHHMPSMDTCHRRVEIVKITEKERKNKL